MLKLTFMEKKKKMVVLKNKVTYFSLLISSFFFSFLMPFFSVINYVKLHEKFDDISERVIIYCIMKIY